MDHNSEFKDLTDQNNELRAKVDELQNELEKLKQSVAQGSYEALEDILFKRFTDMLPAMIYEVNLRGKIIFGNKRALDFFGFTLEDIDRGLTIANVFPDDYKAMIYNLSQLTNPVQASNKEYFWKRKDGTLVPIVAQSVAVFKDGKIKCYRGVLTDISKQKEYEDQISREKAFLEHLVDSTPQAIAITDIPGKILRINREFTNLFGYSPEESVNHNIFDLIVPDEYKDGSLFSGIDKREVGETIRMDRYGRKIFVSRIKTPIMINDEISAMLVIYQDITNEKKNKLLQEILYNISNTALKQLEIKDLYPAIVRELSKIWETKNLFIAIYNKMTDSLSLPFFADEEDSFYELPARKTLTGWVIRNNRSILLKEKEILELEKTGEVGNVGSPCKVWMGVPLRVEDEIIGAICLQDYHDENKFSHDDLYALDFIANQVAIAIHRMTILDNLVLARQKAEEAALAKQQFMSTMSHEIRTPMNEVIGITNLLLQGNPREDQIDFLKTLKFSGNHLLTLVNDVLDYNKIEMGKVVFEHSQFNLTLFLNDIVRSYSIRAREKKLEFRLIKSDNLPEEVLGDSIRLNQILSNLLSNALKFTQRGEINIDIKEIRRAGKLSTIEFRVKDTGIGIPEDKLSVIFESFSQGGTEITRNFGGTGLGLTICKKLVELQGGTISVESEYGAGSTFRFDLTFGVAEPDMHSRSGEQPETFEKLKGKKILVAEDNKINYFVVNKFLTGWGVVVTHAENGQAVLDLVEREYFDLLLLDLQMPVLDGFETTRLIRNSENDKIRDLPVVALTAAMITDSQDKIADLKINDFILKPFKPRDLYDRITRHIR